MKLFLAVFLVWVYAASSAQVSPDSTASFPVYPWDEASPTARVSKQLLKELPIPSVEFIRPESQDFTLTPAFIQAFRVTASEAEHIARAIREAQHAYRSAELRNLEHQAEDPEGNDNFMRIGARDQVFHFLLKPFPEEAEAIHAYLEKAVADALGKQRAEFFLENGGTLKGHMPKFPDNRSAFWNRKRIVTCTFVLPAKHPGRVDRYYRSGGGGHGLTFGPTLDAYAPEPLKTALVEWRKNTPAASETGVAAPTAPERGCGNAWNDASEHVDFSKETLGSIKIVGLTEEEQLAPEICALLGLGEPEQASVMQIYARMRKKFEALERENFKRVEPGRPHYLINAFPDETAALRAEWSTELKKLLGATRGELLDAACSAPFRVKRLSPEKMEQAIQADMRAMRLGQRVGRGQNWLHRGSHETRITFEPSVDGRGRQTYRYDYTIEAPGGARGGGTALGIPGIWSHLFTPDVLGAPAVF